MKLKISLKNEEEEENEESIITIIKDNFLIKNMNYQ